jgi:hypothetical protein
MSSPFAHKLVVEGYQVDQCTWSNSGGGLSMAISFPEPCLDLIVEKDLDGIGSKRDCLHVL